jgi:hypothetical protein
MALTVTPDLTNITTAETTTGWTAVGSQSALLEPDFFVQGSNCISRAVSGNGTEKGMVFDNGAAIDFTTGTHQDKLVYIWMRSNTPGLMATRAAGGMKVRLGVSTSVYREWNVAGSDAYEANEGWVCFVIDPQSAGTATNGAYNANSVQFFGGTMTTTTTAKGQNFGIDRISYGRGELRVTGTVTTAGEGFKEIAATDWGSITTGRWGITAVKNGIIFVRGKIVIGHATSNTTFSSRNENVVFETTTYYNGTNVVKAIPDASVNSVAGSDGQTSYTGLGFIGGTGTTAIDLGVIAGTDSGRSGPSFSVASADLTAGGRVRATVSASDASMALSMYATSFTGFEGPIDLYGTNLSGDDCFATTFNGCGRLDSNMQLRNCNILNSVALTTDGAFLWRTGETDLQKSQLINNSRAIVFETGTGGPFTFADLSFSNNTFDVRNESGTNITINLTGTSNATTKEESSGTITYVSSKTLTLTGLKNPTEVRIYNAGTTTEIAGQENVTTGTFTTGIDAATYSSVDISIISLGYQNTRLLGVSMVTDQSIPVQQVVDRQYLNP